MLASAGALIIASVAFVRYDLAMYRQNMVRTLSSQAQILGAKDATRLTNLLGEGGGSPQSMETFEIAGGALPHYKLYDRSGKLRQTFALDPAAEKQFTPEEIEAAVAKLLTERGD